MLPTLGPERRATYSPFLPLHPRTRVVCQVPILDRDTDAGTITWRDEQGELHETPVTGGAAKLQWKPDWAMRWTALGVDYEMAGKDLIDSVRVSSRICKTIGGTPPDGFNYELFLDECGEKISKSKGNGLAVEDWLTYAPSESLSLFMYQKPKTAKRLFFDVIPKNVDEFYTFAGKYNEQPLPERLENPVWHITGGAESAPTVPVSFAMLLNLVSASNSEDRAVLWGFISRYAPTATPRTDPELDKLVGYAVRYYHDFVRPAKVFRSPTAEERAALAELAERLEGLEGADGETIQAQVYAVGKAHFEVLREWFGTLYQVLLGQQQGPRFGSFVALYGVENTRAMIADALEREEAGASGWSAPRSGGHG
jgi:lysyl-tRNA synthetase class 1